MSASLFIFFIALIVNDEPVVFIAWLISLFITFS